ncbi:MAG: efflux RND transporter periplasmic adaptor subunit [Nitrospira sp.]|nr:efflux RND transporter periplasmic adaptor subunit [bacterium]MBL7049040.1 efflux RND transporter periplasmic adaptor subunit [Nitrospira sp.]
MFQKLKTFSMISLLLISSAVMENSYFGEPGLFVPASVMAAENHDASVKADKKIKYWVAPMDPAYIRDKPGKSPMGMDLVPVYEDAGEPSAEGVIKIDPVTVQNIGVRTAIVTSDNVRREIHAAGRITYNEKLVEHIHSKVSGWIENLYVDTGGQEVSKGEVLLDFYSPVLVSAQEEYLTALKYRNLTADSAFTEISRAAESLLDAAQKKLLYLDISPAQIEELQRSGEVQKNISLLAGKQGTVIEKFILDGMKINPGMELYTMADLSRVWVIASVYEYEIPFIRIGQAVEMTLVSEPGVRFAGKITFIYPYISGKTRTIQLRMEFDNPEFKLKPDMYADVVISSEASERTPVVPSEAVLRTGSRNVVITSLGDGKFLPKEVTLGVEGVEIVQILAGLKEGEEVVTSGQFLIDSESNLREAVNKMLDARAEKAEGIDPQAGHIHEAEHIHGADDGTAEVMGQLLNEYLKMHEALVRESAADVAEQALMLSYTLADLSLINDDVYLQDIAGQIENSLPGLSSGDLDAARNSFKMFSRAMFEYLKNVDGQIPGAEGVKAYHCPMENEYWIQKEGDLKNPYLGEDMWICGTEEELR